MNGQQSNDRPFSEQSLNDRKAGEQDAADRSSNDRQASVRQPFGVPSDEPPRNDPQRFRPAVEPMRQLDPQTVARLARVRHVALDLDGTLYTGDVLLERSLPALAQLAAIAVPWSYLTNNSSRSRAEAIAKLARLGLPCSAHQLFTSTDVTVEWLRLRHPAARRLYVLGTPGLASDLRAAGFDVLAADAEPDIVVVGFDTTLTYARLCEAAYWIARGKPFVATHPDRVCPTELPTVLVDCGAICAALSAATGREPDVMLGKPHPVTAATLLARLGIAAEQLAVVGDRLYTDIALARTVGALGVLVLSGETSAAHVADATHAPDLVCADVGEFAELLAAAR